MFVTYKGSVIGLLAWQWRAVLLYVVASTAVVVAERWLDLSAVMLPGLPVAVVGGAIGIFVSFRTNSAYDRWWEGRKLWGQLVNSSRHFCSQVLVYLPGEGGRPSALQVELIRRQIAYVHSLRVLLRQQDLRADPELRRFVAEAELGALAAGSSPTHSLQQRNLELLAEEVAAGRLSELRMQKFDDTVRALLDVQGGCERIKKTPFPKGYGFIAERLIQGYGVLLPLGLVGGIENDWIAIPLTVLVCLSFSLISEVGRVLEDPFTMFWPALPLSALATTIEINLRERLGEEGLPALPVANERGVLM
jgi:putative membrane protein